MTGHTVIDESGHAVASDADGRNGRIERRGAKPKGLVQLGWPQFWLLGGILTGILALVLLVLLSYSLS
jgi:hypothetical protein